MSRTAVIAVAAAVVLLGTAQIATKPDRVPDAPYVTLDDGTLARTPAWATVVMSGAYRRPAPLSASVATLETGMSGGVPADSCAYRGGGVITSPGLAVVGTSYTQIVVSPAGRVLVMCRQTVLGWVPPCLLDGTTPVG